MAAISRTSVDAAGSHHGFMVGDLASRPGGGLPRSLTLRRASDHTIRVSRGPHLTLLVLHA
jgi:hypothetical protein